MFYPDAGDLYLKGRRYPSFRTVNGVYKSIFNHPNPNIPASFSFLPHDYPLFLLPSPRSTSRLHHTLTNMHTRRGRLSLSLSLSFVLSCSLTLSLLSLSSPFFYAYTSVVVISFAVIYLSLLFSISLVFPFLPSIPLLVRF